MKALVKAKAAPGLELQDVPEPEIGINDVLIQVDRTGICGTDLHIYNWDAWAQATVPTPLVIGLEMSGNPQAFRDLLANMCHGGKIALLGIPSEELAIDWNKVIFNMLTLKGIYGREMYETWYMMTVLVQGGLDISPVITHRLPYTDFEEGFAAMNEGSTGKVILNWLEA
jgi:threonine dehydrogenase-like Zn-dependent dehydrogenase